MPPSNMRNMVFGCIVSVKTSGLRACTKQQTFCALVLGLLFFPIANTGMNMT